MIIKIGDRVVFDAGDSTSATAKHLDGKTGVVTAIDFFNRTHGYLVRFDGGRETWVHKKRLRLAPEPCQNNVCHVLQGFADATRRRAGKFDRIAALAAELADAISDLEEERI